MPTSNQFELFEDFAATGSRAPRLELPFQRKEEISFKRAQNILGISKQSLRRMLDKKLIRAFRPTEKRTWRIEYASVVEYCDRIRILHHLSDRRLALGGTRRRYRDDELLPFPLSETIGTKEVQERLDCSHSPVTDLIESGELIGYQILFEMPGCPWRIHRPSLDRYIASLHAMAAKGPSSRIGKPPR